MHDPAHGRWSLPGSGYQGHSRDERPMKRWVAILLLCLASVYLGATLSLIHI